MLQSHTTEEGHAIFRKIFYAHMQICQNWVMPLFKIHQTFECNVPKIERVGGFNEPTSSFSWVMDLLG